MAFERIVSNGVTEILKNLVPVVAREISLAWGVEDDLKKLQDTLEMILIVIADAGRKQINDAAVRLLFRRLKDVAYDADDVMDEFSYETMRRCERGNRLRIKARDFFSSNNPLAFRFEMARKIKHINQRLAEITEDMSKFHLQTTPASNTVTLPGENSEHRSRETASCINESNIIGREDEKEKIVNMLTKVIPSSATPSGSDRNTEKVSVVSIVGMGGLGKTTLAQLVYNDEMVNKLFELKLWVHVSQEFDVEKLLIKIMESSTKKKFDSPSNFEILISGAAEILRKMVGAVSGSALGLKDDLKELKDTFEMILAKIADAEKRQRKEEVIRVWLSRLKDIAYDADDVIDEFSYEDLRRSDRENSSKHKVINFPSSSNPPILFQGKMRRKIKKINEKLENITKDMDRFQLEYTTPIPDGECTEQLDRAYTSHVFESEIVGRESDETHIIKLLTTHNAFSSSSSENISVISIVGMGGGLGKTTLAQLAYKDELVSKVFELKMWVHVSEIFDIQTILVRIMEFITGTKFHEFAIHTLGKIVQEKLQGKKYLLVLDDLWNEDLEQWGCLMSVLPAGAAGSKILITTRNDRVASIVRGNIPPYNLNLLTDDACWSIVKQRAFSPVGALNDPQMSDIGKQIAKKCCGLPLAAKFLRGLLRSKNRESDWISIRDDDNWNTPQSKGKVLPVLKLSYNHLTPHLKQCFSYCSIFPKNWDINKETLIHLWMAEGYLKKYNTKNKISVEDFGCGYFESLAWSSFFQDFKKNNLGDIETCKMHDLVHDLAKDVAGENEVVSLKISELKDVSVVRRLQLHLDVDISATSQKSLSYAKKLRTLIITEGSNLVDPFIFSENHQYLRVLHVGSSPNDTSIARPKWRSLSLLKHLRYLHLTSIDLREVENDRSIGRLYNLETLVLNSVGINVQILLSNIHSLKKLRYLEVSSTDMVELPDSITSLSNLQTLDLNNCELKVIPDSISGLKSLRILNLSVNPFEELPVSVTTLSNLETLDVNTCKNLKALPEYVACLSKLRLFDFKKFPLLRELPNDFGALTQLRSL